MRSSWVIETARRDVYATWTEADGRFEEAALRAARRSELFTAAMERAGRSPDRDLVAPHARWIRHLMGDPGPEDPLAEMLLVRLGDWVEAHATPFLGDDGATIRALGDEERAALAFPSSLPPAPGFEPVVTPEPEPPGEVTLRFAILGDLHIGSGLAEAMAAAAVEDINASGAELVVQLGDITDRGNKEEFEQAVEILGRLEAPVATMMGNHDVFSFNEEALSGRDYFSASFGRQPDGVILERSGFRFAVLDSVEHAASPFGPFSLVTGSFTDGTGGAIVRGSLTPVQHDLLAEIAEPGGAPVFLFLHHPPQPFTAFPPILFGLRDSDSGRIHATCDSGNVWGVFAGHTHRNARTRDFGTVPAQEVGIPRDFPFGFAIVDVTDGGYAYRFVQISDEDLLRQGYRGASALHRRYALGEDHERAFVWTRS